MNTSALFIASSFVVLILFVGVAFRQAVNARRSNASMVNKIQRMGTAETQAQWLKIANASSEWVLKLAIDQPAILGDWSEIEYFPDDLKLFHNDWSDLKTSFPESWQPIGCSGDGELFVVILRSKISDEIWEWDLLDKNKESPAPEEVFPTAYHYLFYVARLESLNRNLKNREGVRPLLL